MMNTKPIGGYFELELNLNNYNNTYHFNAIGLNSGRCCLEYILKCRKYKKIYLPYFTCDSILDPIKRLGLDYSFYNIDENYFIRDEIILSSSEAIIYTNYWGLLDEYCKQLAEKFKNQLILDYTQAFYSLPVDRIDTFYSCRKFFGVPDGGYVYTNANQDFNIGQDISFNRIDSLIKRIDLSAEEGFSDFKRISKEFHNMPIAYMSKFTSRMMSSIDYLKVLEIRRKNYLFLQSKLGGKDLQISDVPMVFPYKVKDGTNLRKELISKKIYVATYWPNVLEWCNDYIENDLVLNTIPLPIDQRYNIVDMQRIVQIILNS